MKFGLTEDQYTYILNTVVAPLNSLGGGVFCYGSRARGDYQKFSDLDLMVETKTDLSKQINTIKEELSNSNFPYKVDLVQLSEFAKSYVANYEKDKAILSTASE